MKPIRIAIQKEGRLKNESLKFLKSLGLKFQKENERNYLVPCQNFPVEILFVRHRDVPQYVQYEAVDFGICGENLLFENDFQTRAIKKLGFGKCALVIAVPEKLAIERISQLQGERIATSYPNSLRKFLQKQKISAAIIEIKGAVEITPILDLADVICDLTQTGQTLRQNNLKPIATLFESEAVLIESMIEKKERKLFIANFLDSLNKSPGGELLKLR